MLSDFKSVISAAMCFFGIQRFAFGGKAYQYRVLPFCLALAPRMFTKCMDAVLAPLRLQGIRVLNHLDDCLKQGSWCVVTGKFFSTTFSLLASS